MSRAAGTLMHEDMVLEPQEHGRLAVCRRERSDGLHDWDAAVRVGRPGCGHASITCGRRQEGGG